MELVGDVVKHGVEVGRRLEAGRHRLDLALDLFPVGFDGEVEEAVQPDESDDADRGRIPAPIFASALARTANRAAAAVSRK